MRIGIIGLGYVGIVSAACFAALGHQVIGYDIDKNKVEKLNKGECSIYEERLSELLLTQYRLGKIKATTDIKEFVEETFVCFVCVGTPGLPNGGIDFSQVESVCKEISQHAKTGYNVCIRSTMFPGSYEKVRAFMGPQIILTTNPEFLREGSAINDFYYPPHVIVGATNKEAGELILKCYSNIKCPKWIVDPKVAQIIKYVNNSWHAVKVTFGNEIGSICKELGIPTKEVMSLFFDDKKLNMGEYYLTPGFAYSGSCLSKDTNALIEESKNRGLEIPLLESVPKSNRAHVRRAIKRIENCGIKKIGFLGLAFKPGTDDTRNNPLFEIIVHFQSNSEYNVEVYDEYSEGHDINKTLNQDLIILSTGNKQLELSALESGKEVINLRKL